MGFYEAKCKIKYSRIDCIAEIMDFHMPDNGNNS